MPIQDILQSAIIYKFQGRNFISSVTASTEETPLYANLGSPSYKWGNIYANNGTINTSDRNAKRDISDIDEKILKAWGKVNYKVFKLKNGDRIHVGVIAQDIDEAFKSGGLMQGITAYSAKIQTKEETSLLA